MNLYLDCLQKNNFDHIPCRELTKQYLQCRMDSDNGLMAKEDLSNLGLGDDVKTSSYTKRIDVSNEKIKKGYIAGLDVRPGRTFKWLNGE